ncbi:hypothetical protein [Azospirillum sp. sgz302134]
MQLSRCSLDDIASRQQRCHEAGVRGAWLVGFALQDYSAWRDLPVFRLVPTTDGKLDPWVAHHDQRSTPLRDFVQLLLTRRVVLDDPPEHALTLSAIGAPSTCWRCFDPLLLLTAFVNAPVGQGRG